MKRFRKIVITLVAVLMLTSTFMLVGCGGNAPVSITSVQRTNSNGLEDEYTLYYSDGRTDRITIQHGKDITVEALFDHYKEVYGDDLTYSEFLDKYLTITETNANGDNSAAIGMCLQSSVKIYTEFAVVNGWNHVQTAIYTGSGVIYKMDDANSYIITNYHVVYNQNVAKAENNNSNIARKIVCYLYGSEGKPQANKYGYEYGNYAVSCDYIGGSVENDIAVLRVNTKDIKKINPDVKAAEFADSYHVGETAIAIGNPEGAGISVTEGVVSVDNEYIQLQIDNIARAYRSLRIDTAIYGGSSGGGLYNLQGKLIGITNAGNQADQNINYAIPLEIAKGTADNILYYYNEDKLPESGIFKVIFGFRVVTENSRYVYDASKGYGTIREDIIVESTEANSIASKLKLEINDRLVAVNVGSKKLPLDRNFDISDIALTLRPGDVISFDIVRGGMSSQTTTEKYTLSMSDFKKIG